MSKTKKLPERAVVIATAIKLGVKPGTARKWYASGRHVPRAWAYAIKAYLEKEMAGGKAK